MATFILYTFWFLVVCSVLSVINYAVVAYKTDFVMVEVDDIMRSVTTLKMKLLYGAAAVVWCSVYFYAAYWASMELGHNTPLYLCTVTLVLCYGSQHLYMTWIKHRAKVQRAEVG